MKYDPQPIVRECIGCDHIHMRHTIEDSVCQVYVWPEKMWAQGKRCPMCTVKHDASGKSSTKQSTAKKVNPLKQSKRKAKGKG